MVNEKDEGIVQTTNLFANRKQSGESRSSMHNLEVAGAIPAPATRNAKFRASGIFALSGAGSRYWEGRGEGEFPVEVGLGKPWVLKESRSDESSPHKPLLALIRLSFERGVK